MIFQMKDKHIRVFHQHKEYTGKTQEPMMVIWRLLTQESPYVGV